MADRKAELRRLLQQERLAKKWSINDSHPIQPSSTIQDKLARYNAQQELSCILCKQIITKETSWNQHILSKQHITRLREVKALAAKRNGATKTSSSQISSSSLSSTSTAERDEEDEGSLTATTDESKTDVPAVAQDDSIPEEGTEDTSAVLSDPHSSAVEHDLSSSSFAATESALPADFFSHKAPSASISSEPIEATSAAAGSVSSSLASDEIRVDEEKLIPSSKTSVVPSSSAVDINAALSAFEAELEEAEEAAEEELEADRRKLEKMRKEMQKEQENRWQIRLEEAKQRVKETLQGKRNRDEQKNRDEEADKRQKEKKKQKKKQSAHLNASVLLAPATSSSTASDLFEELDAVFDWRGH